MDPLSYFLFQSLHNWCIKNHGVYSCLLDGAYKMMSALLNSTFFPLIDLCYVIFCNHVPDTDVIMEMCKHCNNNQKTSIHKNAWVFFFFFFIDVIIFYPIKFLLS